MFKKGDKVRALKDVSRRANGIEHKEGEVLVIHDVGTGSGERLRIWFKDDGLGSFVAGDFELVNDGVETLLEPNYEIY